jgi:hypothetical protein
MIEEMGHYTPAYIEIAEEGRVTLFWGDGTEAHKEVILRGPRVRDNRELYKVIEELKAWAEDNGYTVVVPAYDLEVPDMEIDLPDREAHTLTREDIDGLIDDLHTADGDDEQ